MKRQLIVLVGLPGAGKTRWARKERYMPETFLYSWVDVLKHMCSPQTDPVSNGYAEGLSAMLYALVRDLSKMTTRLIVDATNHTQSMRQKMIAIGVDSGREVICEMFDVPREWCEVRSKLCETDAGKLIFDRIASTWQDVIPEEGFREVHYHHGRSSDVEAVKRAVNRVKAKKGTLLERLTRVITRND